MNDSIGRNRGLVRGASLIVLLIAATTVYAGGSAEVTVGPDGAKRVEVDNDFAFSWRIDGGHIEATISAPTTGWVAIGFNPERRMEGATYVIGYVDKGAVEIRHDYGVAQTAHQSVVELGGTSRVTAVGGREIGGRTELSFRLPLDPGGEFFSPLRAGAENTIIWAFGPAGANNFTAYHQKRGSFTVDL